MQEPALPSKSGQPKKPNARVNAKPGKKHQKMLLENVTKKKKKRNKTTPEPLMRARMHANLLYQQPKKKLPSQSIPRSKNAQTEKRPFFSQQAHKLEH
jgi:hypothetical protein